MKESNISQGKLKSFIGTRSCTLLGLGVSHLPLARALAEMGTRLTVIDKKSPEEMGEDALLLQKSGVSFISGDGCFDSIEGDIIFRSPGIRPDLEGIKKAVARGALLTSETELFLSLTSAATLAVTGSDGKTTTTTLTGKFLEAQAKRQGKGSVFVGGNIGRPLLTLCDAMSQDDTAVLELSSFQLMTLGVSPEACAITNLSPNHLDWHTDMDEYEAAKRKIIGDNTKRLVANADNAITAKIAVEELNEAEREVIVFSSTKSDASDFAEFYNTAGAEKGLLKTVFQKDGYAVIYGKKKAERLLKISDIIIPGRHNVENYMTAMALTYGRADTQIYTEIAKSFGGVEHRLELVRTLDCVDYYNSSIDSSPTRTAAALSALHGRDIVVICGGYDKKIPFEPLAKALCESARAVVLTGATAPKILSAIEAYSGYDEDMLTVVSEPDFVRAVSCARALAKKGGCVLLSPACASFDAFKNFSERGEKFRSAVNSFVPEYTEN